MRLPSRQDGIENSDKVYRGMMLSLFIAGGGGMDSRGFWGGSLDFQESKRGDQL